MSKKLNIHDTCGVNNLHGMPGLMAGISGILVSGIATYDVYQNSLFEIWPARDMLHYSGRSAGTQAGYQAAALVTTMVIAIAGGIVTGITRRIIFASL
jgi:ammonium transporter Rh